MEGVDGVALELGDLDGRAVVAVHDAGAFAEHFNGTDTGTAAGEDVGFQDFAGGAAQVAGGDALDEAGDVNVGGAGGHAWGVEAVEAAVGFNCRGLR